MISELTIIALRTVRHTDKQSILTAYSRSHGRISLAIPAGKGRSASRMQALTMPLSILTCVADIRPGRDISAMRSAMIATALPSLHSNPVKQMTAMFLAEVLATVLRDNQGEGPLFDFIAGSIRLFDSLSEPRAIANFHLWFLYRMGVLLGIEPDTSTYTPGSLLDMRDGLWRQSMPLHGMALDRDQSAAAWNLSRMTVTNMHLFAYTRSQRNALLDRLMDYFSVHLVNLARLKSTDILRYMMDC